MGNALTMWYDPATYGFGGGGDSKEARRQTDIQNQSQEFIGIIEQALAQLVPGSEEYQQLTAFGQKYLAQIASGAIPVDELGGAVLDQQPAAMQYAQQLIQRQQQRVAGGGAATPMEARTQAAFDQLRTTAAPTNYESDVFSALGGMGTTTPSGDIYQRLIREAGTPVTADELYQSTTEPEFQLVREMVGQSAARRGIANSGLELESLGRAGVDLAIQSARRREESRKLAEEINQQRLANFGSLYDTGQTLRNRGIGVEEAMVDLQSGRESRLTELLAAQSGRAVDRLNSVTDSRVSRAQDNEDFLADQDAARRNQIFQAAGTIGGAFIGGPVGAGVGNSLASQLSSQRAPVTGSASPSSNLSINSLSPDQRNRLIDELLRSQGGR